MLCERYGGFVCRSTGDKDIGESLSEHVDIPPFIPYTISEDVSLSWIFMGSPGPGANLHVSDIPTHSYTCSPPERVGSDKFYHRFWQRFVVTLHSHHIMFDIFNLLSEQLMVLNNNSFLCIATGSETLAAVLLGCSLCLAYGVIRSRSTTTQTCSLVPATFHLTCFFITRHALVTLPSGRDPSW